MAELRNDLDDLEPSDTPDAGDPGAPVDDVIIPASGRRARKQERRRQRRMVNRPLVPVELTLTGFGHGGYAIGHLPDGRIALVRFGIPGERVIAEIEEEHTRYVEATVVRVLEASPARVTPPCAYFGRCGGCQLQHIAYGEQLRLKRAVVIEQLERIGHFEDPPVRETQGMTNPWAYRNHMRFTVRRDGSIGFMERGTHRFLRIDRCEIAHPAANEVLRDTQTATMQTTQISIRVGENTGEVLVQPRLQWRPFKHGRTRSGQPAYHEVLLGQRYQISAPAFFQVNTRQAERLVDMVVTRVRAVSPNVVVDAYAGVGTFAAALSRIAPHVITIEYSAAAGDDAAVNLGEYPNVRRVVGTVEEHLPALDPAPDVVVVDPPRIGLEPSVIDAMIASSVRRVVYVSCEPATLARDLRRFVDGGFTLAEVQPLDMFPHTQHIETVVTLDRRAAA